MTTATISTLLNSYFYAIIALMSQELLQWGKIATSLVDYDMEVVPRDWLVDAPDGRDFEGSRLAGKLRQLRAGTFMAIGAEFGDIETGDASLKVNAYEVPEMSKGRQESQWMVKFCQLVLRSKSQGERTELVAMKPVPAQAAAREYHSSEAVADNLYDIHGYRTTFTNLGFFRDKLSKRINLVSRYEHSVQSADVVMWNRSQLPSAEQTIDVFRKAANSLADLHGHALVGHGDAQPKNIASDNRGVRIIDLEGAVDFKANNGGIDTFRVPRLIEEDLRMFLTRLGGVGLQLVDEHFAERYVDRLAGSELLPSFVQPTIDRIRTIAREPQQDIPYMTSR